MQLKLKAILYAQRPGSRIGFTLIEAAHGMAGLKLLRSNTRIDLLVTDVGLPGGINGRQMADAGRTFRPDLKTLFITGYAESAVIGNAQLGSGMQVLTAIRRRYPDHAHT